MNGPVGRGIIGIFAREKALGHVARILADKARLKGSDSAFVPRIRHDDNARDQPEIVDQFVEKLLPAVRPQGCIKRHGHEFHKLAVDHITSRPIGEVVHRSEEHTSELQSLMRISYAVFCLKKNTKHTNTLYMN